jgi:hypothetical protein
MVVVVLQMISRVGKVECKHLACSSGHCTHGIVGGILGLLKVSLKSCSHGVFRHLGCSFSFLGLCLGFRGSTKKFTPPKKMPQMPFLELLHVYIYYMTSHIQFGCQILPTAIVMSLFISLQRF